MINPATFQCTTLVYFSPTHTTQKVLRAIAAGMGLGQVVEVNLTTPAARSNLPPAITSDLLLLGMPVYEEHIPTILLPILNKLSGRGQPAVVVAVYGNVGFGVALREMAALASESGFRVVAGAAFTGEHSFSHDKLPVAAGRPDQRDLQTAQSFGARIAARLNGLPQNQPGNSIAMPGKLPLISRLLPPNSSTLFAHLPTVDPEACIQCGACARACPAGAIDADSLQIDESKCLRCFACVRACRAVARVISLRNKWISYPFLKVKSKRSHPPVLIL